MDEAGTHNRVDGTVHGPVVQVGKVDTIVVHQGRAESSAVRSLPRESGTFLNRQPELTRMTGLLDTARGLRKPASLALTGIGGVGKTSTGLRLVHQVAERFTDGQLYADLGGSSPTGPVPPSDVLAGFLRHFGVSDVPPTLAERAARFRSHTAEAKFIVFLDDAASATQVRELLPSSPDSAVLVTSRVRLDGLIGDGFDPIQLFPLADTVAFELVAGIVGAERAEADRAALMELVEVCGCLPLALRVAATQMKARQHVPAARFVARMRARKHQLLEWMAEDDERLVEAVFEVCYRDLDQATQRAYRLLGLWTGQDLDLDAAAALLDQPADDVEDMLGDLVKFCLLDVTEQGRYRFHTLIRLHARNHAEQDDAVRDREQALDRIVTYFRDYLIPRDKVLSGRPRLRKDLYDQADPAYTGPDAPRRALADLELERPNLLAAVLTAARQPRGGHAWQLCDGLVPFYSQGSHFEDWIASHESGLADARQTGNRRAEMRMRHQLGSAYFELQDDTAALREFTAAMEIAVDIGDALGEQSAWEWIGLVHERLKNFAEAAICFDHSLDALDRVQDEEIKPRARALLWMNSGRVLVSAGQHTEALPRLSQALAHFRDQADEVVNVAKTLTSLGEAQFGTGQPAAALSSLDEALSTFAEQGPLTWEAYVHKCLGTVHGAAAHEAEAARHTAESVRLYARLDALRSKAV